MKTELEEASEKSYPLGDVFQILDIDISEMLQLAFINGAEWQQERSYNEEDMISLLEFNYKKETNGLGTLRKDYSQKIIKEWFEQFKKK